MSTGETTHANIPMPACPSKHVRIRSTHSLVSIGTERMIVEFGRASMISKARQQPDKVKMVVNKIGTDGLAATVESVRSKLDQPMTLGYCNVGIVAEAGDTSFKPGMRVLSNGTHAEYVCVGQNLVAEIPESVSSEDASFTPLAAIGLQGIRLINPELGETVAVIGLGLIGLITVQLLLAQGCRVIGFDFDPSRIALAEKFGVRVVKLGDGVDPVRDAMTFSNQHGVDAVVITASTKSSDPVSQAARMCRKRGRIVLVGVTGLELDRAEFYEKELSFQVSCSYGPGRYDRAYEELGQDYPYAFVRWTEKRNFEAVLELMAQGKLDMQPLISNRISFDDAAAVYGDLLTDGKSLGIIIQYSLPADTDQCESSTVVELPAAQRKKRPDGNSLGVIGAGNYASRVLIPGLVNAGADLHTLVSEGGVNARHYGEKFKFARASTDNADVLNNPELSAVVIATRHDTHAELVTSALHAGKSVFVEKPLALTSAELDQIEAAYKQQMPGHDAILMVGFNRRFAPMVKQMRTLLEAVRQPKCMTMTVNAGAIPANSWVQSRSIGGGRIIGEACHFVDLLRFLAGVPIVQVKAIGMADNPSMEVTSDNVSIVLGFADGSVGNINYFANGGSQFPKERLEVFAGDGVLQLDNFRKLEGYGWGDFKKVKNLRQDKGQDACIKAFVDAITSDGPAPIPYDELIEVSRYVLEIDRLLSLPQSEAIDR